MINSIGILLETIVVWYKWGFYSKPTQKSQFYWKYWPMIFQNQQYFIFYFWVIDLQLQLLLLIAAGEYGIGNRIKLT